MGDAERYLGGTQLRLMKACRRNLGPNRQGRKRNDIGDDLALDLNSVSPRYA